MTSAINAALLAAPMDDTSEQPIRIAYRARLGAADDPTHEIVLIHEILGPRTIRKRLIVRRGQEGTTSRPWPAGTVIEPLGHGER